MKLGEPRKMKQSTDKTYEYYHSVGRLDFFSGKCKTENIVVKRKWRKQKAVYACISIFIKYL